MSEYIEREAFLECQRHLYCDNCARRKNGKGKFVYEIGDAPCRACDIGDVLDAVEDFPAADAIAELSKPRWIPVTERLPSYGDWVLGIGPKKGYYVCEYRGIVHWSSEGYDPWFSAKGSSVTITHWMPLPEPPKEE